MMNKGGGRCPECLKGRQNGGVFQGDPGKLGEEKTFRIASHKKLAEKKKEKLWGLQTGRHSRLSEKRQGSSPLLRQGNSRGSIPQIPGLQSKPMKGIFSLCRSAQKLLDESEVMGGGRGNIKGKMKRQIPTNPMPKQDGERSWRVAG